MPIISNFDGDVNVIQKLGDNPNTDNNLTADALRGKFDEAGALIKAWINETLIPSINKFGESALTDARLADAINRALEEAKESGAFDGRGIDAVSVGQNGHLILTMTDKSRIDAGNVRGVGVRTAYIRTDGHLLLELTDGTSVDAGALVDMGGGLSGEEKALIMELFGNALYEKDMTAQLARLQTLFGTDTELPGVTYRVTFRLTNMVSDVKDGTVEAGDSLVATLTASEGYTMEGASVRVTMGGTDITGIALNGSRIEVPAVTGDLVITGAATAAGPTVWTVRQSLTNLTSDVENPVEVNDGDRFTMRLTATYGYKLEGATATVTMGGTNITDSAYKDGVVTIAAVTGDVQITASAAALVKYTVTRNLRGYACSNDVNEVWEGQSYSAKLTMLDGYKNPLVKVLMSEVDITASAYAGGIVSIPAVTGNVILSAIAETLETYPVVYDLTDTTSSNMAETIQEAATYETELTAQDGYTLTDVLIKMGGADITGRACEDGRVSIDSATGEIYVKAVSYPDREVKFSLTNCAASNQTGSVKHGSSYFTRIVPREGYVMLSASVSMGGVNISDTVVTTQDDRTVIRIPSVTEDVSIVAVAVSPVNVPEFLNVSVTTRNCKCTVENGALILYGQSLYGRFIPDEHYVMTGADVRITMDGADVTALVYNEETAEFSIAAVTGDLTLYASTDRASS